LEPADPTRALASLLRLDTKRGDSSEARASGTITRGELDFGPWEQIFYGEFDGRRPKRVLVKVIGE
jgi:hypothetical protein